MDRIDVPNRYCPLCSAETTERVCLADGTTTLLRDAPASDPSAIEVGDVIANRYKIERLIGRGGFGAVFAARHTGTGQEMGLKVLASGADDRDVQRFFREARMTASLTHPNTIRVFDFGQSDDGTLFIAMELLRGRSVDEELRERCRQDRAFTEREAIDIGTAVASSLAEAHEANLVHRDLKPQNLFLHEDRFDDPIIKVLDFGIAKGHGKSLTGDGIIGTPTYMSPEQARGESCDSRSDIYSLGVVLFHLVAGRPPFDAEQALQVLMAHVAKTPPRLAEAATGHVSDAFDELIDRCLRKDPGERFDSAESLMAALRLCAGDSGESRPRGAARLNSPTVGSAHKVAVRAVVELEEAGAVGEADDTVAQQRFAANAPPVRGVKRQNSRPMALIVTGLILIVLLTLAVALAVTQLGLVDASGPEEAANAAKVQPAVAPATASTTASGGLKTADAFTSAASARQDAAAATSILAADTSAFDIADTSQHQNEDSVADGAATSDLGRPKARRVRRHPRRRFRAPARSRRRPRPKATKGVTAGTKAKAGRPVLDDALDLEVN